MQNTIKSISSQLLQYGILLQAAIATAGSLYFSEVMHLPPCVLCWYQRIAMYPIVLLAAVGIIRKDKKLHTYVLALAIPGVLIAIFHNLLYWGILPESASTCSAGISCTAQYIEWLGFVTIPFLSLVAFAVIIVLAVASKNSDQVADQAAIN